MMRELDPVREAGDLTSGRGDGGGEERLDPGAPLSDLTLGDADPASTCQRTGLEVVKTWWRMKAWIDGKLQLHYWSDPPPAGAHRSSR